MIAGLLRGLRRRPVDRSLLFLDDPDMLGLPPVFAAGPPQAVSARVRASNRETRPHALRNVDDPRSPGRILPGRRDAGLLDDSALTFTYR